MRRSLYSLARAAVLLAPVVVGTLRRQTVMQPS